MLLPLETRSRPLLFLVPMSRIKSVMSFLPRLPFTVEPYKLNPRPWSFGCTAWSGRTLRGRHSREQSFLILNRNRAGIKGSGEYIADLLPPQAIKGGAGRPRPGSRDARPP